MNQEEQIVASEEDGNPIITSDSNSDHSNEMVNERHI
jgi:hypothetical protein